MAQEHCKNGEHLSVIPAVMQAGLCAVGAKSNNTGQKVINHKVVFADWFLRMQYFLFKGLIKIFQNKTLGSLEQYVYKYLKSKGLLDTNMVSLNSIEY